MLADAHKSRKTLRGVSGIRGYRDASIHGCNIGPVDGRFEEKRRERQKFAQEFCCERAALLGAAGPAGVAPAGKKKVLFQAIGRQQTGVAHQVIAPMPGDTTLPFRAQGAPQPVQQTFVLLRATDLQFVRPKRNQRGKISRAVISALFHDHSAARWYRLRAGSQSRARRG